MRRPTESVHGLDSSRHTPCAVCQGTGSAGAPRQSAEQETVFASANGTRRVPATLGENPRIRLLATRRGVTVLIVLLLLSITLGLSYAIVRSQTTALQIQRNASSGANRSGSARQTAMTGMVLALKKMHTSEWCYGDGVNTTLSGPIGDYESYHVIYAAGDPALALDDPDSPYRVTLLSTGKATDPSDPERTSTHRARAVVRLVPRSVADEPTDWSTMQEYTVYQSKAQPFKLDIPCRLEGKVRIQGSLHIAPNYPTPIGGEAWRQYLEDLRKMSSDPDADYRPLSSRPVLDHSLQTPQDQDALEHLGVWRWWYDSTPSDETEPDWGLPSACVEYQIYPGGPVYEVPQLGARVEDAVLGPDPEMNPLGIFQRVGDLAIGKNVTVRGSLFSSGRISMIDTRSHGTGQRLPASYKFTFSS